MTEDETTRAAYPGKTSIQLADQLYVKLASFGAKLSPPMSAQRLVEQFCLQGLDRAAKPQAIWPPEVEERKCKPN